MNPDSIAYSSYLVLLLVLIGSGFAVRRVPIGQSLKMFLGWCAIFGIGFVLLSFRHDVADLWSSRVGGHAIVSSGVGGGVSGGTVRVPMADDGHFWVDARINGSLARLMVDSGATVTTLSPATAAAAGIAASGLSEQVGTANGTIEVRRGCAATFAVGNIEVRDLGVHLARDDFNVVGMNFLSKLSRWSVEGHWLVLQP